MVKVTNTGRSTYDFVVPGGKVKDGVPETISVAPGESADLDASDVRVAAAIAFGDLTASDSVIEKAAASLETADPSAPPGRRKS